MKFSELKRFKVNQPLYASAKTTDGLNIYTAREGRVSRLHVGNGVVSSKGIAYYNYSTVDIGSQEVKKDEGTFRVHQK